MDNRSASYLTTAWAKYSEQSAQDSMKRLLKNIDNVQKFTEGK